MTTVAGPDWIDEIDRAVRRPGRHDGADGRPPGDAEHPELRWLARHASGDVVVVTDDRSPDELAAHDVTADVHAPPGVGARDPDTGSDPGRLPVPGDSVDTLVLDRVLETVAAPDVLLDETVRVLRDGGRVAIIAHLGVNPDPNHRRSLYPSILLDLLSGGFTATSLAIDDRHILVVAERATGAATGREHGRLLGAAGRQLEGALHEAELGRERWRAEAERRYAQLEEDRLAASRQQERSTRVREQRDEARSSLREAESALRRAEERIEELERDHRTLRERLAAEREKRRRMRRRRWWRLGELLAAARRDRRKLVRLPVDVVRLLREGRDR